MIENLVRNIKRYRLMRGMDQERIAGLLGISRVTYSKLENGKVKVSDDMFYQFSKILGVPTFDLLDNPEPKCSQVLFRHRKPRTLQEKECVQQMLIDAERKFSGYEMLEQLTDEKLTPRSEFLALRHPVENVEEAKALGVETRDLFFRQGFNHVNLFAGAIESNGVRYLPFDFKFDGEFGFTINLSDGDAGIAVNTRANVPGERQLFTLCHEVGHLLMHEGVKNRSNDAEIPKAEAKELENQANAFASGLLMPDADFDAAWRSMEGQLWFNRVLAVKRVFSVSYQTVIHRLEEKYRASTNKNAAPPYRVWFRQNYRRRFGRELPPHEEACPADIRVQSSRYVRLARQAFLKSEITMSRLAELLGKTLLETRDMANEWAREETEAVR